MVEYSDFQCPACAGAAPVVSAILETYGEDIRFEYRHFPLISIHPLAIPASRAAEQQGKFFEMHDLIFENQRTWSSAANPTVMFIGYAEELGLDIPTFRRHMGASLIEDHVRAQFEEARQLGLTGTPTFFLNGERMNFQSYEEFATQIEAAVRGTDGAAPEDSTETTESPAAELDLEFGV